VEAGGAEGAAQMTSSTTALPSVGGLLIECVECLLLCSAALRDQGHGQQSGHGGRLEGLAGPRRCLKCALLLQATPDRCASPPAAARGAPRRPHLPLPPPPLPVLPLLAGGQPSTAGMLPPSDSEDEDSSGASGGEEKKEAEPRVVLLKGQASAGAAGGSLCRRAV
jgi:hypothetical protein